MKPKALMLLAVAVVCGLVAMMGVQQAMSGSRSAQNATKKVFVAAKDLKPGVPLTKTDVVLKEITVAAAPADAIQTPEQYEERALKIAVLGGEVITLKKLHEKGKGYGTSMQIPTGMRVMTISADANTSHSGMVNPGDRVDVNVTFKKGGTKKMETKVLLEAVEVFAADAKTQQNGVEKDAKDKSIKNVSLLLLPEQVPYVTVAQAKGKLSLILRNPTDDEVVNSKRVDEALLEELNDSIGSEDGMMFGSGSSEVFPASAPVDLAPEGPIATTPAAVPPAEPAPGETVQDFVARNQAGTPDPAASTASGPPAPPVDPNAWTIQVYSGNKLQSVAVADDTKKTSTPITGWLQKLMQPK